MGITISLRIIPGRINADEWMRFYQDSLRFLQSYPGGIIGSQKISINSHTRYQYTRNIELNSDDPASRCWRILGTLEGLALGESFELYANLAKYTRTSEQRVGQISILDDLPNGDQPEVAMVFNAKTQGMPYHHAILAVGILAEWRFPDSALVSGDLDIAQARVSIDHLNTILGETGPLPLLTDAQALYDQISQTNPGLDAMARFWTIFLSGDREGMIEFAQVADRNLLERWQKQALCQCTPKTQGVIIQCIDWLNATADVSTLVRMACLDVDGPLFDAKDFIGSLAQTGIALEPDHQQYVAILRKPSSAVHTIFTLLGTTYLNIKGLAVHQSHNFLGETATLEALSHVFPERNDELAAIIKRKTAELSKNLRMFAEALKEKQDQLARDPETGNLESFRQFSPRIPLTPNQDKILEAFAEIISVMISDLSETLTGEGLPAPLPLRELILSGCDMDRIALPEDSWAWIDAEQDDWYLSLLVCVLGIASESEHFAKLRTALMTHRELCVLFRKKCELISNNILNES